MRSSKYIVLLHVQIQAGSNIILRKSLGDRQLKSKYCTYMYKIDNNVPILILFPGTISIDAL